jgi:hypothetical protein
MKINDSIEQELRLALKKRYPLMPDAPLDSFGDFCNISYDESKLPFTARVNYRIAGKEYPTLFCEYRPRDNRRPLGDRYWDWLDSLD